jgi:hypothetical protein
MPPSSYRRLKGAGDVSTIAPSDGATFGVKESLYEKQG